MKYNAFLIVSGGQKYLKTQGSRGVSEHKDFESSKPYLCDFCSPRRSLNLPSRVKCDSGNESWDSCKVLNAMVNI